jgi:hypothetical protein
MMKLSNFCRFLLQVASAVTREFPKSTSTQVNGFPKAAGNFMNKSAEPVKQVLAAF